MELYIHLPFCRSKCRYCDFASFTGCEQEMEPYVDAVLQELEDRISLVEEPVTSLFLGGGTPSILPPALLDRLLRGVRSRCHFSSDAEITSEANPGTLSRRWLDTATACGVNRLSLGMQAAQNELLKRLGRIHTLDDVVSSVLIARSAGIHNLNLDLMFGLPGQDIEMWHETLQCALSLSPEHLSCYGLIPEDGTPLKALLDAGEITLPDEETERAMYDSAIRNLQASGFIQYEISNFALPGFACRHNLGYWKRAHYLGLGVSAASMLPSQVPGIDCVRETNPATLPGYLEMIRSHAPHLRESEQVTEEESRFETLMLGLRMTEGIREQDFLHTHGISLMSWRGEALTRQRSLGTLECENGFWRLTRLGMDIQNTVLVDLMEP
ncbi:MAG: radical SAM family heme chaperone HemW [Clostridia bacterium]|nr:radical SAM family heme chaperone HemW [Clostridia bacterium]